MTTALFAVTAADRLRLADGSDHPCGFWPEELGTPHKVLRDAGIDVVVATPGAAVPTPDPAGMNPAWKSYLDTIDELAKPLSLEEIEPGDIDLLFVPGGHAPMADLAESAEFGALVSALVERGTPVAAVCHGPAAFLSARAGDGGWLFDGYRMTVFTNTEERDTGLHDRMAWLAEDRLRAEGGVISAADEPWAEHVVVDRALHTGQNPASAGPLAKVLVHTSGAVR
ncbi:type 1 glutamine amidotransferase domain-containing protein [Amycolatopsis sp. EV170708-02-1]|uniref:type 1 glutamine amidotransferase domain-containing protein n=1 Tax=Amycolatopsis sp. EV170708-02-1 TaxID=2919322 RepID=UPI001F0C383A|nr:type 1 glutamine amidotransferase domain-containing protein [Amycolatopsis sp. EV170708-02-1]UMO99834.1 type 1 glutamine amidotransferase domain-containing protein [Amycolatopsis sp. EV170708-02-1]